ncbi:CDGSH iron-sulfur domain-containing protein [Streptomyces sp. NPDC046909]|uniref:CDGSH iron-sulfur domain-containing protein n=1 Tax=Streptomyces sp. NPDC046909 TaxID=3155617 RepID=UPI00340EDE5B
MPNRSERPRRVTIEPGGPLLVEGPVEVELPDGGTATSRRFQVALCTCRRSRTYPWCDTSHRRRPRPKPDQEQEQEGEREGEREGEQA